MEDEDKPYSNRELREKWHDLADDLQEIKLSTKLTNGKVADIIVWRERANGAFVVFTIVIIPILSWALYVLVNIKDTIHSSVVETLQAYDIQLKP